MDAGLYTTQIEGATGTDLEGMMRVWFLAAATTIGCDMAPNPGGQFGEEAGGGCEAVETTPVNVDESAPNGVVPQSILDFAIGTTTHELAWMQLDQTTGLTLTVAYDGGAISFVDDEYVSSGDGMEPAIEIGCEDRLEIEVDVTLQTDDGAFDESFSTTLSVTMESEAHLRWSIESPSGTFDPWDHAPEGSEYDEMRAWLDVTFDASDVEGTVSGQGSGVIGDPNDPDSAAFAESIDIGQFGGNPADQQ